jgi:ribonuclease III
MAFLRRLGVDPTAAGGPGDSAAALAPIEEALSHSSAGQARNHEKLEFLGDAVLRLAATEVLQRAHPSLSVGQCSSLRAQLVSDRWLAELAERCDLPTVVHLGPMAMSDRAGRATVLAETCEALVGGMYSAWGAGSGGLAAVEAWLAPHWQRAAAELLADPHRHNWKSALQEWSQGQGRGLPGYTCHEFSRIHGDPGASTASWLSPSTLPAAMGRPTKACPSQWPSRSVRAGAAPAGTPSSRPPARPC